MATNTTLIALDPSAKSIEEKLTITNAVVRLGKEQDSLHLVSVVQPIIETYIDFEFTPFTELSTKWQHEENHRQQTLLEEFAADHLPSAQPHVTSGNAASEIRSVCRQVQAELIVMGAHKHHGLGRILGSTVSALLNSSNVDVLAVQLDTNEKTSTEKYQRVLVAVDLSTTHAAILARVAALELDSAQITFISVAPNVSSTAGLSPYRKSEGYDLDALQNEIIEHTRTLLCESLQSANLKSDQLAITTADPGSTIVAKADEISADLIIIGASNQNTAQRWLLGSTTSYVMNHANSDVYVVC